ncbi:MAG: D-alanine--D-alanine ligase [Alphaproteobacteria bacterium]
MIYNTGRKRVVAVLMGGWSSEREVSLDSGQAVVNALSQSSYEPIAIDVDRDIGKLLQQLTPRPDVIFNALHGFGGEDGVIQGLLESLHIPYTHSGVLASALGMDKVTSRELFIKGGMLVPLSRLVSHADFMRALPFPLPFVIKPRFEGSSRSVCILETTKDYDDLCQNWPYGDEALVEEYLSGREIHVAVMGDRALGAIEIIPKKQFYDYEAKYTDGCADHIMPAPIPGQDYQKALDLALRAHQLLGCRGVTRSDFIYKQEQFYLLEINTQPGMTALSLVPEIAAYNGISFQQLIEWMILEARCDQ